MSNNKRILRKKKDREMKRLDKPVYEYDPEDHIEGEDIIHHF